MTDFGSLTDFWGKRDVAGLLLMPANRHLIVHLNEALRLKKRRRRGLGLVEGRRQGNQLEDANPGRVDGKGLVVALARKENANLTVSG